MQNKSINGFTLLYKIGEGGMAEVWYAENGIGKKVSIKIIKKELALWPEILSRFENEAKVMVTLDQPNIRQVYDYTSINERPCIIMEYLEGADLSERLKKGQLFAEEDLRKYWNQLADALNYTHSSGIVHRDIKPSNIFLTNRGIIKILDFGIAKIKDSLAITQTGTRMGTLLYMSPEQVKDSKHLDHRTDIYSLAVTFYHLQTGLAPYDKTKSSEFEIQTKIVTESLQLDKLPADWRTFLAPYLKKDAEERPKLANFNTNTQPQPWPQPAPTPNPETEIKKTIPQPEKPSHAVKGKNYTPYGLLAVFFVILFVLAIDYLSNQNKEKSNYERPTIEWVNIPAGTFMMGSPESEKERGNNETQHQVTLSAFKMSKYEVTYEKYDAFCDATGRSKPNDEGWGRGKRPVLNVSWNDAKAFADWMDCRLPTEAEWEYAARAGTSSPFSTGTCLSTSQANYDGNYPYNGCSKGEWRKKTLPVGSLTANAWGLHDMHGNVWEWCLDLYDDYPSAAQTNPKSTASGSSHVIRGGGWYNSALMARSAKRDNYTSARISSSIGFRLVTTK